MTTTDVQVTNTPLILSTGTYDLLKFYVQKKKLSRFNEKKVEAELKSAQQILRKDIPADVVTANTLVQVKGLETGEVREYKLVSPAKARNKNKTVSMMSPIGIAMLGYREGAIVQFEIDNTVQSFEIVKVSKLN